MDGVLVSSCQINLSLVLADELRFWRFLSRNKSNQKLCLKRLSQHYIERSLLLSNINKFSEIKISIRTKFLCQANRRRSIFHSQKWHSIVSHFFGCFNFRRPKFYWNLDPSVSLHEWDLKKWSRILANESNGQLQIPNWRRYFALRQPIFKRGKQINHRRIKPLG